MKYLSAQPSLSTPQSYQYIPRGAFYFFNISPIRRQQIHSEIFFCDYLPNCLKIKDLPGL